MLKTILTYGIVAGLIAGVSLTIITLSMDPAQMMERGLMVGYTTMLLAFITIFVALKRRRDDLGAIRFWPAFALGVGITFVAAIIYVAAWEIGQALSGGDFALTYANAMIEQRKAAGVSGDSRPLHG